jgi:hypothetical protein
MSPALDCHRRGRELLLRNLGDWEKPKALEPGRHLLQMAVEDACDRSQVVAADGEHAAVVVAPLPLDDAYVPSEHLALAPPDMFDGVQVQG